MSGLLFSLEIRMRRRVMDAIYLRAVERIFLCVHKESYPPGGLRLSLLMWRTVRRTCRGL